MKNIKKLIIILLILLVISCLLILAIKNNLQNSKQIESEDEYSNITQDFIQPMQLVGDYSTFLSVEKMINNYIGKVNFSNADAIYSIMDKDYINDNNITKQNILQHIANINKYDSEVRIREMYSQTDTSNKVYYIYGMLEKNHKGTSFYFVLYEDLKNITYSVAHINEETYKNAVSNSQKLEEKQIEPNDYNSTIFVNAEETEIITK